MADLVLCVQVRDGMGGMLIDHATKTITRRFIPRIGDTCRLGPGIDLKVQSVAYDLELKQVNEHLPTYVDAGIGFVVDDVAIIDRFKGHGGWIVITGARSKVAA